VRQALSNGKSVVTANKQLIAHSGPELLQLARTQGKYLGFGACVAGGVPILSALQDGLAGDRLVQIHGILNGTCNFILSRIEQANSSFADALSEAQRAGFAEADPSFDIDGQDAGAKLAILARFGLKTNVVPEQVICRSIRDVSAVDFAYARELNSVIRQISLARLRDGEIFLSVGPALVSKDSPLAKVTGSQNLVVSTGEFGGETTFGGYGAGGDPTAVAVLSDLVQAANHRNNQLATPDCPAVAECDPMRDFESPQYVRFVVRDRAGIIASLAAALAKYRLNIDAILQKPGYDKSALPFVITLESCGQRALNTALREISKSDFLVEPPLAMPVVQ
jgi:homoserine dehydrogenase